MIVDLQPFKDLVRNRCGLMLEGNGEETLKGALAARMHASGCASASAYLSRLGGDSAEFQELVTLLTINETYFFREPEQLALVTEKLVPRLLGLRAGAPLRILSAGCSTGEEPYSIAMALMDNLDESVSGKVHLVAGDIDHLALAKARAGHYSAFSFRGTSDDRRQRYFSPIGRHGFALADVVRDKVQFHHLNLLSPQIGPDLADFDIVLFRNVSIYFDTATREAIQRNLSARMKPDGILLVGIAETLANDLGVFRLVEEDGLFFFTKAKAPCAARSPVRAAVKMPPVPIKAAPVKVPTKPVAAPVPPRPVFPPASAAVPNADGLEAARVLVRDERYEDAARLLRSLVDADAADMDAALLYAHVQNHRGAFAEAEIQAHRVLEHDQFSVAAAVLLGFSARSQGDHQAALRWFKQAVYCRHDCWVAQYYLAETLRALDQAEPAKRAYRLALQQLTGAPDPDAGLGVPLGLPLAEIRFLCERHAGAAVANGRR